ncbi:ATP-dependent RNA helicase TDRD9 [Phaenicophaeus curvirostris]|uniref:ATP-dependent RNA helicase TDRD9 n=1 Tax=Phaenicophaeus curvirostris TaxID=33595 RepID=UPI0037F0ED56
MSDDILGTSLSECELNNLTSEAITNHEYVHMPVAGHRREIVHLIKSNSVVIIQGATGSGKSTEVPQYILDDCIQQSVHCNIAVIQPRRIGASSLARWICKKRSWKLGGLVGYQVCLEDVSSRETRLLYMTARVFLERTIQAKSLAEFTHVVIDEVHERTKEIDLLLLMIRKLLCTNSQFVKVILMSASINCEEFADYFALSVPNGLKPACVFKVEGRAHAIEDYYLDDLKIHFKIPSQRIQEPGIEREMYKVAVSLIRSFDEQEMKGNSAAPECGSVLVFLPGLGEIRSMLSYLSSMRDKRWQVCLLHSSMVSAEQNNVLSSTFPGYRKVILCTDIAESSITVPDVKYVIDFCLTKTWICDEETNYQSLRLCWASKNNCKQRRGRAGRVSKGYCYRLVHKDFWTQFIPETLVPEIACCLLGSTILKLKRFGMGEPKALLATALSPPSLGNIERSILHLKELGALATCVQTEENQYDGEVTFLGKVLAHLPLDLHLGKLIVLGHVFGCLEESLIIAATLSVKNFFAVPFGHLTDRYRNKLVFADNSKSDCIAIVNAFKAWRACRQNKRQIYSEEELEWCRRNYIDSKRIREVEELFNNLKMRVRAFNMFVNDQSSAVGQERAYEQRFILQVVIAGAFYPNYFTLGKCEEDAVKQLAGKDPETTVMLKHIPPYGFLYHKQLQSVFRQCGRVKSIAYEGSKAFVEFGRHPVEGFKILPAVYLSVKMSQLKIPFKFNVHCSDYIKSQLQDERVAKLESLRVNVDCEKQTVEPVKISSDTSHQLRMFSRGFLPVHITAVVEVGHFWGQRTSEENRIALQDLTDKINNWNLIDLSVTPHPGLFCLAPFTQLGHTQYYRARILRVCRDVAEVFYVDYGNRSEVPLKSLKEMLSSVRELPFQALEFKMCKMRPSAKSLVFGERWSYSANERFASIIYGRSHIVKVYSFVHSVLHVDLFGVSESYTLVNIRDLLVEENYAEPAEEPYESQLNHDLLEGLCLDPVKMEETPVSSREEKNLIETLLKLFPDNKPDAATHKVMVSTPSSPYEVKCYGMNKVSRLSNVVVQQESINSVAISHGSEDRFQQLLVAASLSANVTAAGSAVHIDETTLMPPIPGLLALISMLFAPTIELRVDGSRKSFTGALCGLGWSQTCQAPLLPENEMELTFDVRFGVEDITEINILRIAINELLRECEERSEQERIRQLQQNVRQKFLSLICRSKPRDIIAPTWYGKPFAWNQVDSQYIVDQSEGQRGRRNDLYQLHKLIQLNV